MEKKERGMTETISYCNRCGKRLPGLPAPEPTDGEYLCVECRGTQAVPVPKEKTDSLRKEIAKTRARLGQAAPPRPLPSAAEDTEKTPDQTSTSIIELREQVLNELRADFPLRTSPKEEKTPTEKKAPEPETGTTAAAKNAAGTEGVEPESGEFIPDLPPEVLRGGLPEHTKQALYALLGAALFFGGAVLFVPRLLEKDTSSKAAARSAGARVAAVGDSTAAGGAGGTKGAGGAGGDGAVAPRVLKKTPGKAVTPAPGKSGSKIPGGKTSGKKSAAEKAREAENQALREVERVVELVGERPGIALTERALRQLRVLTAEAPAEAARRAREEIGKYEKRADELCRKAVEEALKAAATAERAGRLSEAKTILEEAAKKLSSFSPWARTVGKEKLTAATARIEAARQTSLAAARAAVERAEQTLGATEATPGTQATTDAVAAARGAWQRAERAWPSGAGEERDRLRARLTAVEQKLATKQKARATAAREAWRVFFREFDAAVRAGDAKKAARLCSPTRDSPLLFAGAVERPREVLAGFAGDSEALRACRAAAATAARRSLQAGKAVYLSVPGTLRRRRLLRVDAGGRLVVRIGRGVETAVALEKLSPAAFDDLLAQVFSTEEKKKYGPALRLYRFVTVAASKSAAERADLFPADPPFHWAQRAAFDRRETAREEWAALTRQLRRALGKKGVDEMRRLLRRVDGFKAGGSLAVVATKADLRLLEEARRLVASRRRETLIFQNGRRPTADYMGMRRQVLSERRGDSTRNPPGVQLRIGSYGGLKRTLLRFDGLAEALAGARVLKATLSLYQSAGDPADGAEAGLFRLRKAWRPGAGDWHFYNRRNGLRWGRPGAASPKDIAPKSEALLRLDARCGLWRSWDITAYVRDVAAGKEPNHGLLLKIVRDEPRYAVLFSAAPASGKPERPELRPMLVVEIERSAPAAPPAPAGPAHE